MRSALTFFLAVGGIAVGCGGASFTSVGDGGATGDGGGGGDDASASDGGGRTDGSTIDGGSAEGGLGLDGGNGSCSGSSTLFNNVIKACTVSSACIVVMHQVDCCGSEAAVGINHASHDTFDTDEMAWRATCPACGCAARPTTAEDGKSTPDPSLIQVACVNNVCRTYIP